MRRLVSLWAALPPRPPCLAFCAALLGGQAWLLPADALVGAGTGAAIGAAAGGGKGAAIGAGVGAAVGATAGSTQPAYGSTYPQQPAYSTGYQQPSYGTTYQPSYGYR